MRQLACSSGRQDIARTGFRVRLEAEHDFRRSVPSRCNVFGHVSCVLFRVHTEASRQTEIANLELAVGVDEQVAGLQVTVEDVCGVYVLQTAENLVNEGLEVCVGQWLSTANDGGEITFHEFCGVVSGPQPGE